MSEPLISGPHVQIATLCDMVVEDKTGAICVIRAIDRFTVVGNTAEMQPAQIKTTMALCLKPDMAQHKASLKIQPVSPSGEQLPPGEMSILFEGRERGVQLILPMQLMLKEEGLYWFDILVDGQRLTRIPLRLIYQFVATGQNQSPQSND